MWGQCCICVFTICTLRNKGTHPADLFGVSSGDSLKDLGIGQSRFWGHSYFFLLFIFNSVKETEATVKLADL